MADLDKEIPKTSLKDEVTDILYGVTWRQDNSHKPDVEAVLALISKAEREARVDELKSFVVEDTVKKQWRYIEARLKALKDTEDV